MIKLLARLVVDEKYGLSAGQSSPRNGKPIRFEEGSREIPMTLAIGAASVIVL